MTSEQLEHEETFEEFKNSFSYGSRSDMNFKFLKGLSTDEAAVFFADLLRKLGNSFDDGYLDPLIHHVYEWQAYAYAGPASFTYDDGPFAPLQKPLSESRLALMTTSGHFVADQDPEPFGVKNMSQEEAVERVDDFVKAEPRLATIPIDTPDDMLRVRHAGYDIAGAQIDANVVFPRDRLRELVDEGIIGELVPDAYSFMGTCSQLRLRNKTGPEWLKILQRQEPDMVLLVPV